MVNKDPHIVDNQQTFQYTFTVFTPTYNRKHTLHRVYNSLKVQTYHNFEWLIVDDGSTDNTHDLVKQWQAEADFAIRYIYQNNQGKHTAYNLAAREAGGKFIICLDSDDGCIAEALARFKYHWDTIPEHEQDKFSGIDCLCQDPNGNVISSYYPLNSIDSNYSEIRYRYKVAGEKWGFQRTVVMQEFPFPETPSNNSIKHIPENVVWSSLTKKYKARYVNEGLRIYYPDSGTQQLTKSTLADKNSFGLYLMSKSILEVDIDYFQFYPQAFILPAINYSRSCFHLKTDIKQQFMKLNSWRGRLLWLITLPLGYLVWLRDQIKKSKSL